MLGPGPGPAGRQLRVRVRARGSDHRLAEKLLPRQRRRVIVYARRRPRATPTGCAGLGRAVPLQVIPRHVLRRITASGSATVICRWASTTTCRWPALLTRRARVRRGAGGRGQRGAARPPVRRCPLPSARYQLLSVGPHTAASCDARVLSRARPARLEPRWEALPILMERARKRLP